MRGLHLTADLHDCPVEGPLWVDPDALRRHCLQAVHAARALGKSEGQVAVAVHRLRVRFRHLLRRRIAETLQNPTDEEIEGEWQALLAILGDPWSEG